MNNNRLMAQTGVGFIETLLILLLVSVSVVALIKFQHVLSYGSHNTQQQFDATILANKQMETLCDFQVLNTTTGYKAYADIASGSSNTTVGYTAYSTAWTVTTNTDPDYKTIDLTVTWTDRLNTSQSVRLVTQVAGVDPASSKGIK
jgi:Tfp pilus assembly protein PilV